MASRTGNRERSGIRSHRGRRFRAQARGRQTKGDGSDRLEAPGNWCNERNPIGRSQEHCDRSDSDRARCVGQPAQRVEPGSAHRFGNEALSGTFGSSLRKRSDEKNGELVVRETGRKSGLRSRRPLGQPSRRRDSDRLDAQGTVLERTPIAATARAIERPRRFRFDARSGDRMNIESARPCGRLRGRAARRSRQSSGNRAVTRFDASRCAFGKPGEQRFGSMSVQATARTSDSTSSGDRAKSSRHNVAGDCASCGPVGSRLAQTRCDSIRSAWLEGDFVSSGTGWIIAGQLAMIRLDHPRRSGNRMTAENPDRRSFGKPGVRRSRRDGLGIRETGCRANLEEIGSLNLGNFVGWANFVDFLPGVTRREIDTRSGWPGQLGRTDSRSLVRRATFERARSLPILDRATDLELVVWLFARATV